MRHPMYLGAILMFVGGPLVTGAASALAVGVALSLLLAVRIVEEEKLLAGAFSGSVSARTASLGGIAEGEPGERAGRAVRRA